MISLLHLLIWSGLNNWAIPSSSDGCTATIVTNSNFKSGGYRRRVLLSGSRYKREGGIGVISHPCYVQTQILGILENYRYYNTAFLLIIRYVNITCVVPTYFHSVALSFTAPDQENVTILVTADTLVDVADKVSHNREINHDLANCL